MDKLRVFYQVNGAEKYEEFEPKLVDYGRNVYLDTYSMWQHAQHYAECLKEVGAKHVELRWSP